MQNHLAIPTTIAGAVLISFSGVWVTWSGVAPEVSAFYRVLFGGLFLLAAALWRREVDLRPRRIRLSGRLLLCSLMYTLDLYCYHVAILLLGPGLGTILPNFQVFILAAAGVLFFAEPLRWMTAAALPVAVGGLWLIVGLDAGPSAAGQGLGLAAGLAAALFYAAYLLLLRRVQADQAGTGVFRALMQVSFLSALLLGLEIALRGHSFAIPDLRGVLALLGLGVCSQGIGWILITNALPQLSPTMAGLLLLLQPTLAFVWDVLIFRRPTSGLNWLGVGVTLVGIYLGMAPRRKGGDPSQDGTPSK
ncbi:MAG: DMT family transporter [Desulfosarcinaceae bacterium]|nr:DMT family transporter [Desulfosarcinaceae bacterium]